MKPSHRISHELRLAFWLGGLLFCLLASHAPAGDVPPNALPERLPAPDEFDAVGKAVVELIRTHDVTQFATNLSVSSQDWLSVPVTNLPAKVQEQIKGYAKNTHYGVQQLESGAKAILSRADALHLDFSKGGLDFKIQLPKHLSEVRFAKLNEPGPSLPYLDKLEITLVPDTNSYPPANGDFKIVVQNLEKFSGGWRITRGLQWTSFPTNVVDEKTLRELALMEKISDHQGFNGQDDSALLVFSEGLIHFIRERDTSIYAKESLINSDRVWDMFQKSGQKGPTRKEVDEEIGKQNQQQVDNAEKTVNLMKDTGIDLKTANIQIKEASVQRSQSIGSSGSLDNVVGDQFKLVLAVKTDAKAGNGTSLAGEYVLGAKQITRMGDAWMVMDDVHWQKLPDGIVGSNTIASMKFENYVAEHGTLPPKTPAPAIEFTTLVGEKKLKLSDMLGKVVILDFWATWCGPCQEPMADLQTLRQNHPDWQDKVVIMPLSIDDTLEAVRKHVDQRGWTNTFNVWSGDGGWHSAPATAFRVHGVPTTYVIDQQGKVVWAGHPAGMTFVKMVAGLLKP